MEAKSERAPLASPANEEPPKPAKLRPNPERSCVGKRRYANRKEAKQAVKLTLRSGGKSRGKLAPYQCIYCSFWHIGHNRLAYLKKKRAKAKNRKDRVAQGNG